jgi:hypothetical protein
MRLEPWHQRVADPLVAPEVASQIADSGHLVQHFGRWPTFEDAELVSIKFNRGNHMAVAERDDWRQRIPPTLEARFYVFNAEVGPESSERRPAEVSLQFSELHEAQIQGLGCQNPIQGLGIHIEQVESLRQACFRVNWGGAGHEVSLLCTSIAVCSVEPNP